MSGRAALAVDGGHVGAVRALLEHGANPLLRVDGISPIQIAAEAGHRKIGGALGEGVGGAARGGLGRLGVGGVDRRVR